MTLTGSTDDKLVAMLSSHYSYDILIDGGDYCQAAFEVAVTFESNDYGIASWTNHPEDEKKVNIAIYDDNDVSKALGHEITVILTATYTHTTVDDPQVFELRRKIIYTNDCEVLELTTPADPLLEIEHFAGINTSLITGLETEFLEI